MFATMYKAYTGIVTNSQALGITANNLANANTVGFKRSSVEFSQLINQFNTQHSGNGNPRQIGLGAITTSISPHFTQGTVAQTGINTNLALLGNGFFVTSLGDTTQYTRAGNFGFSPDGVLLAANGARVQGYTTIDADGHVTTEGGIGDITVDFDIPSPPRATSLFRMVTNLSASAQPGEDYRFPLSVYDSNGELQNINIDFVKSANDGEWTYTFSGADATTSIENGTGTLSFDSTGQLISVDGAPLTDPSALNRIVTVTGEGFEPLNLRWDLVGTQADGTSTPYFTSYGDKSSTGTKYQDGFSSGELQTVDFRQDGTMIGFYTNGATTELARIAVAQFTNVNGLQQVGGSAFRQTNASGQASLDTSGRTSILGHAVETSNVDIAEELVSMIVSQRGFQGNSKAVTTSDQVLQEILNLKR